MQIEIVLPQAASLKDRRQLVRSLKDHLRRHFNVSVAEMDEPRDLWQRASIGVAAIGSDTAYLLGLLQQTANAAERLLAGQIVTTSQPEIVA